jgi:predicted lysophospholipase L1 biosynthesis ABC-type transport system permease subunit
MQETESKSLARTSFTLVMLAIAGSMALVLGVIGIYGVISYTVSQRRREIGIRLALGAQRGGLRWMFVRSALVLTGVGVAIGLGAAAGLTRLMKSLLFGVSPLDPVTYLAIPLVLAACAVLASYLPARRAAGVDPVEALRAGVVQSSETRLAAGGKRWVGLDCFRGGGGLRSFRNRCGSTFPKRLRSWWRAGWRVRMLSSRRSGSLGM